MSQEHFICRSCGKEVKHSAEERPCERLAGWLMVTQWGGRGVVDHCFFCCSDCLRTWADARGPGVPDVFLRAFDK